MTLGLKLVVVATDGKDIDMSIVEFVYEPVLLTEPSRPESSQVMAQGFRFAQSGCRVIAEHFFENCAEILMHSFVALPQLLVHKP